MRRDELHQLLWGDVRLDSPSPFIQLRADTTKAGRADVVPIRADLAVMLRQARIAQGEPGDDANVCRIVPSMATHKRYLRLAGIAYEDEAGRRFDFHALRHQFGTMLSKAGVAPRVAMELMRHTDLKLTMKVYTDPRIFDLAGAVEMLPRFPGDEKEAAVNVATGTDGALPNVADSVGAPSGSAPYHSGAVGGNMGEHGRAGHTSLSLVTGENRQQKSPSGGDGEKERAMGLEPTTNMRDFPGKTAVSETGRGQIAGGAARFGA